MGQSPNSDAYNDDYDGLPLIQGNADIVDGFTKPSRYTTEITRRCQKNDVILSVRAPVGELGIATEECCIGRGVCAIRANDKSETAFIYQLLQAKKKQWKTLEQGSTFTAVSGEDVKAFEVVVPTKEEQQKIAAFFTALGDKIQNNKEKLLLLSKLKASLAREILFHKIAFSSTSSWMEVKLSDVSSIVRGRKSSDSSLYVGTEDLIKNFGGLKKVRGGSASGIGFEKNDILISNIRPYLKKLWMSDEEGISSADVIVFRSKNIEPSLLKHILSTDKFFEHVAKGYKREFPLAG